MTNLFGKASDDRGALNYFSYGVVGGMRQFSGFSYQVSYMYDGRVEILINEDFPDQKRIITSDPAIFNELQAIIDEHNMTSYKGRYEPRIRVLDADSWFFNLKYEYGFSVNAKGVLKYPRGSAEAFGAIKEYFAKWENLPGEVDNIIASDNSCSTGVENFIPVTCKMTKFRFHWLPDNINHICYYVDATTEDPTIYYRKGNRDGDFFALGVEDLERLRNLVSLMEVDNTYEDLTPKEGTGNWYLTVNYDSGDILGINGRISDPRTEEEMKICDPIHAFFKPVIDKLEATKEEMEIIQKEKASQNEEQSVKLATRKWWQFWK